MEMKNVAIKLRIQIKHCKELITLNNFYHILVEIFNSPTYMMLEVVKFSLCLYHGLVLETWIATGRVIGPAMYQYADLSTGKLHTLSMTSMIISDAFVMSGEMERRIARRTI